MSTEVQQAPLGVMKPRIDVSGFNFRRLFFVVNLLGGVSVLGSYAIGLRAHWGENVLLWGGVPESVRGVYTSFMFPAAIGYLVAFAFLLSSDWSKLRFAGKPAAGSLVVAHVVFLLTASAWMPLTWLALDHGVTALFWPIQGVLLVTGLSALWIWRALWRLEPTGRSVAERLARWSFGFLVFQCLVLDALVWPRFFSIAG